MDHGSPIRGKTPIEVVGNVTAKHFRWTYDMECHFLNLLLHEDRLGNRVGDTFTSHTYINILSDMQATYDTSIQKKHLKNKIRSLKQNYSEFKDAFHGLSGFSWNWAIKKFDAESDVWDALIKDNPSAASIKGKSCLHWDNMNTLWSSNRANGNPATTCLDQCEDLDAQNTIPDANVATQSGNYPPWIATNDVADAPGFGNPTSSQGQTKSNAAYPSTTSGNSTGKRKAAASAMSNDLAVKFLASTMEDVGLRIVQSAEILATKAPIPYQHSADLFKAVRALDLHDEYILDYYEYLDNNEWAANRFLGTSEEFREMMLKRMMQSK